MTVDQLLDLMLRLLLWLGIALLVSPFVAAAVLLVSWLCSVLLKALEDIGLTTRVFRLSRLWRLLRKSWRWPGRAYDAVRRRLDGGVGQASVRVVIHDRLKHLKDSMFNVRNAVRDACQTLDGLGGAKGPSIVVADVQDLQRRTEEVAGLGGEIDDSVLQAYEDREDASSGMWMALIFGLAFAVGNAALLGQFFRSFVTLYLFGVPFAYVIAALAVIVEIGLGSWIGWCASPKRLDSHRMLRWVLIGGVVMIAFIEAVVFGLLSSSFQINLPIFDTVPWAQYWLAPFGVVFVLASSTTGYVYEVSRHERARHRSVLRLRKQVKETNAFIHDLPRRWDTIGRKAREAEAAMDAYFSALGGKDGELRGAIDSIRSERDQLTKALSASQIDDWKQVAEGEGGDRRRDAALNVGVFLFGTAGALGYLSALQWFLRRGFGEALNFEDGILAISAWWTVALFVVIGMVAVGQLSFGRLQYASGDASRVSPLRKGPYELAAAAGISALVALGLIWAGISGARLSGFFQSLLFIAGAAGLALYGYHLERVIRGLTLCLSVLAAVCAWLTLAVLALLVDLIVLVLYLTVGLLLVIVRFFGRIFEGIRDWWARRQARADARRGQVSAGTAA